MSLCCAIHSNLVQECYRSTNSHITLLRECAHSILIQERKELICKITTDIYTEFFLRWIVIVLIDTHCSRSSWYFRGSLICLIGVDYTLLLHSLMSALLEFPQHSNIIDILRLITNYKLGQEKYMLRPVLITTSLISEAEILFICVYALGGMCMLDSMLDLYNDS